MVKGLDILERLEYPGRIIIVGKTDRNEMYGIYALTGRSSSSQARKLELDESKQTLYVIPTDQDTLNQGDPELLIYPAVIMKEDGFVISNGKQTPDLAEAYSSAGKSEEILKNGLEKWDFEPDAPNFTPRISGCVKKDELALSIIKRSEIGDNIKEYFSYQPDNNQCFLVSTYTGANTNPLPSFEGVPVAFELTFETAEELAEAVFEKLNSEFKIAVAVVTVNPTSNEYQIAIKNRN